MWPFGVEFLDERVEPSLLLEAVHAGWAGGLALERQVHALVAAVLLGVAGLDALDGDAEAEPPDGQLGQVEQGIRTGERHPVIGADGAWQATLGEETLEGGDGGLLARGVEGFAEQQVAGGVIGDGERVAVTAVAETELTFEVGAPEVVGVGTCREQRSLGAVSAPTHAADQAVTVEHGVNGALGGNAEIAGKAADQQLADLAGAPVRLAALEADDEPLDLRRELVGVANRPTGSVGECGATLGLVATEDFVASFAGDAELAADIRHSLPIEEAGNEAETFFHGRTGFPRHQPLPPKGGKCSSRTRSACSTRHSRTTAASRSTAASTS